jgi:oxygen-independent coproporphyrinogen-3 oxidase
LLVSAGLISNDEEAVKLTKKGRFVGNEVFEEFLL